MNEILGKWAFLLGVLIAVIAGAFSAFLGNVGGYVALVLVVLGLVVGFLNISHKDVNDFLIAAIALAMLGLTSAALLPLDNLVMSLGTVLQNMVRMVTVFVAPAALVVALKAVWMLSKAPSA